MIGDRALVDDRARMVENADRMRPVPEIEADGDEWNRVHGSGDCIKPRKRKRSLPSHLILFDLLMLG